MGTGPGLLVGRIIFPLTRSTNLIGRTDRATGIYPDIDISPFGGGRQISRRHAEVVRQAGAFHVRDLGSRLGTLVNGTALGDSDRLLEEGDAITIADVTLRFSESCEWPEGVVADWDSRGALTSTATQPASHLPLIAQLPEALSKGEVVLHFQPQVLLATGEVTSVEALIRWRHPEMGMVSPESYIHLAEDTGFIRVLTTFLLKEAAAAVKEWRAAGAHVTVGVNLSMLDLEDPTFGERVTEILATTDTTPADFVLEVTESAVMSDPGVAIATLVHLKSLGFAITIDDFGTGQSSLAYLKELPADELKLDRSLSTQMTSHEETIVASTVHMAHELGMTVVAEGVEDAAIARFLQEIECDKAQGYLFGKPTPKESVDLGPRTIPA